MIETQKQYWFFVKPHVYIRNNGNSMLLYNTFCRLPHISTVQK